MKPFLILQLRPETEASDSEFEAILRKGGLSTDAVHRVRLDQESLEADLDLDDYAGVIVGEVMGFRRFVEGENADVMTQTRIRCDRYRAGVFRRGGEEWPVFAFDQLLDSEQFLQAADEPQRS